MGTIASRRRKDGSLGYTAQIRLKRDGKVVHSESETFNRRQLAIEWMRRRETELDQQRARGEPVGKGITLDELLDWYGKDIKALASWGRTKEADLKRLRNYDISKKSVLRLTTGDYIAHVEIRRHEGAGPATANNDLIWLRQVLRSGRASLGLPIDLQALDDASHELRTRRVIGKAKERQRRVSLDEENKLLEHFAVRDVRSDIPMSDIIRFALLSARRQEEITRLKWTDLERDKSIAWLDDVKHPRKKVGNRRAFRLLSETWAIIERQPRTEAPEIFPYNAKSIGAAFTRACALLGMDNLHFHDLRHEATSRLFERGYDIPEVAHFTLHESWTTLKRYTHLKPEHVPERVVKIETPSERRKVLA
jgi:integrase